MKNINATSIICLAIGAIYSIAPDPIPGPIDDAIIDVVLFIVAKILNKGKGVAKAGASKFIGFAKRKVNNAMDARVAKGKITAEKAADVKNKTEQLQERAEAGISNTIDRTCDALGDSATRKITSFSDEHKSQKQ